MEKQKENARNQLTGILSTKMSSRMGPYCNYHAGLAYQQAKKNRGELLAGYHWAILMFSFAEISNLE